MFPLRIACRYSLREQCTCRQWSNKVPLESGEGKAQGQMSNLGTWHVGTVHSAI